MKLLKALGVIALSLGLVSCDTPAERERDTRERQIKYVRVRVGDGVFIRLNAEGPCFYHTGYAHSSSMTWLPCDQVPAGHHITVLKGPGSHVEDMRLGDDGQ